MLAGFIGKFFVLYFVSIIVGLIFNALVAVAINVDAKARDLKNATVYSVLAFFFPLIVGIVYGVTRNNAQKNDHPKLCQSCNITVDTNAYACPKCGNTNLALWANPNADSQMKKSVKIFIVAVVIYVIGAITASGVAISSFMDIANDPEGFDSQVDEFINRLDEADDYYDLDDDLDYYDKNGNSYDDLEDVLYYDKNGNTYKYYFNIGENSKEYFVNTKTQEQLSSSNCFVDEQGFFVYINDTSVLKQSDDDYVMYYDKDGKAFYLASYVVWDSNGNIIV